MLILRQLKLRTTAVDRAKGCLIVSLKVCDVQVAVPVAECLPSDESDATRHCLHSGLYSELFITT